MRKLFVLLLSFLLLSQSVFVNAQVANSFESDNKPDMSFFGIPRLNKQQVDQICESSLKERKACDKFIEKGGKELAAFVNNPILKAKYFRCVKLGSTGESPKDSCLQYYEYGIDRAAAWQRYTEAYQANIGKYWELSPIQLYDKYESIARDIAYLWNINPEYETKKWENRLNILLTLAFVTIIAYGAGELLAPMFAEMGYTMTAEVSSLTLFSPGKLMPAFRFLIQRADIRFLIDLALSGGYMYADMIFVESALNALNDLTKELQQSIQEHADTAYLVDMHNLLLETFNSNLSEELRTELAENEDEIYNLDQQLKEKVKDALKQGWGDDTMLHRESVVTLYALEYIRAEMADISDFHRYRQAGLDIAQVYLGKKLKKENEENERRGGLTHLHKNRNEVYRVAKEAYEIRKAIEAERIREEKERQQRQISNEIGSIPEQIWDWQ